jgi:NNP family nitrate/nitrite transporter-like MFS transporter
VIASVAFWRYGAGGRFPGQAPTVSAFRTLVGDGGFWAMTVLFSLAIGASLGVYTMFPLYLVAERGIDRSWANTLVGLSRVSGLAAVFLAGWAADRIGPRQVMRWVFLLTGTLTLLLGGVPGYWIAAVFFVQQLLAVCFFPAGLSALAAIGPSHARNLAVSLSIPIAFLAGGGLTPTIIGITGDAGSFAGGIVLVGGLILSGFIICLRLRIPGEEGCPARPADPDSPRAQ